MIHPITLFLLCIAATGLLYAICAPRRETSEISGYQVAAVAFFGAAVAAWLT